MKKILITGYYGQLGKALTEYYADKRGLEFINTDLDELDITDLDAVLQLVEAERPYAIINSAGYTAVDACETHRDEAFKVNVLGPRNLAIAAKQVNAKIVHISTDFIFDGARSIPYMEYDTPNPLSVYGNTKLRGEEMVREFCNRYFIFRTAWLYGEGKNFVRTMLQLAKEKDEITVVADQYGTPTSAAELAKAIDSLIFTENYGIYHATCEGSCSWADFAEEIFRLAGTGTKVVRTTSAEYGSPATRPHYSVLDNYMLRMVGGYQFVNWKDALAVYMEKELKK